MTAGDGVGTGARGPVTAREVARLALPAFGALIVQPLFLLADAVVVGRLGPGPLAGLGVGATVFSTLVGVSVFLAYATTTTVAREVGAGRTAAAIRAGRDAIALGALLGTLAAAVVLVAAPALIGPLTDDPAALVFGVDYLRAVGLGLPGALAALAGVGALRGLQDIAATLRVAVGVVALAVVLDVWWVLVLGWGVAGSGWATAVAETVAAVAYWLLLARRRRVAGPAAGVEAASTVVGMWRAARTGTPLILRTIALRAVFVGAAATAGTIGPLAVAAHHVTLQVWSTLALAADALAIAVQAAVALRAGPSAGGVRAAGGVGGRGPGGDGVGGRGRGGDAVTATLATATRVSLPVAAALTAATLCAAPFVPRAFTDDPALAARITAGLVVVALQQPVAVWVFAMDGLFMGAGRYRQLAVVQAVAFAAVAPVLAVVGTRARTGGDALVAFAWVWLALTWFLVVRAGLLWRMARAAGRGATR